MKKKTIINALATIAEQHKIVKTAVSDLFKHTCQDSEELMIFFFTTDHGKNFIENIAGALIATATPKLPWDKTPSYNFDCERHDTAVRTLQLLQSETLASFLKEELGISFQMNRRGAYIVITFEILI